MTVTSGKEFREIERFRRDHELCMKCGFCISACPVYREELVESAVARGKNQLVRGLLSGELELTRELEERLDKCTLCKTCTQNCPAGVQIPSVIIAARADKVRNRGIRFPYNVVY
ncbi:MAG: (Fe-S)-binding protein, partial [Dehalococcoidales bacterium]|nr:(Fe-S)-binding protein [Dehalococcoidales bacterium]